MRERRDDALAVGCDDASLVPHVSAKSGLHTGTGELDEPLDVVRAEIVVLPVEEIDCVIDIDPLSASKHCQNISPATPCATDGTREKRLSRTQTIDLVLRQQPLDRRILLDQFRYVLCRCPTLNPAR